MTLSIGLGCGHQPCCSKEVVCVKSALYSANKTVLVKYADFY